MAPSPAARKPLLKEAGPWALASLLILSVVYLSAGAGVELALTIMALLLGSAISWFIKTRRWRKQVLAELRAKGKD